MSPSSKPRKPPPRRGDEEPKRDRDKAEHDVDEQLDKELEDSFPASDPPSLTQDPR